MKATPKPHPHPKKRPKDASDSTAPFLLLAAKSLSLTLALGMLLLLVLSLAAYLAPDPDALTRPLGLAACALTSFLGGFISVRVHARRAPLPAATVNASLLSALMLLTSLFFAPLASGDSPLVCFLLHTAVFLLSALGALLAMREHPKKHKHRA